MTLVGLLAICGTASLPFVSAQTPSTTTPTKSSTKAKAKKTTTRKPVVRKPPPPPPPAAEIPSVMESASVWRGCLESRDLPKIAASLGIEQARLSTLLEEKELSSAQRNGCVAYVAASGGESGAASAIFRSTEPGGSVRSLAFHKTADGIIATPAVYDPHEFAQRELKLAAGEFSQPGDNVSVSLPSNIRWQLDILVPSMVGTVSAKRSLGREPVQATVDADSEAGNFENESLPRTEPQQVETPSGNYAVRIVLGRTHEDDPERLDAVELIDAASGKLVNGAWWVERPDGPGVLIGMDGIAYERMIWHAPVHFVRTSRGVGASYTTWRRRVPVKKGDPKNTVVKTFKVPGYHIGIDMTAPKGTDVHAVGDATVVFAGRRGGYGNLIVLDHGRGYQTYYAHLSKILKDVKPGVSVSRGDVIGLVGSTGRSTAPHLHFETRKDTRYLDPFDETRQLDFWLLNSDDQERLAMELLASSPTIGEDDKVAPRQ
jgi:murein DD-endopeptidase MepM/ murein hydrolase activator NlpD